MGKTAAGGGEPWGEPGTECSVGFPSWTGPTVLRHEGQGKDFDQLGNYFGLGCVFLVIS